jgi:hypothetical protein
MNGDNPIRARLTAWVNTGVPCAPASLSSRAFQPSKNLLYSPSCADFFSKRRCLFESTRWLGFRVVSPRIPALAAALSRGDVERRASAVRHNVRLPASLAAAEAYRQRLFRLCTLPYNAGAALGSSSWPDINLRDLLLCAILL